MSRQETSYFFQNCVQELIFGHSLDDFAFTEDYTTTFTTGQADISITRLARTIDHTTHNSHMNGRLHFRKTFLNLVGNANHVNFNTPTGRTGYKGYATIAQFK